MAELTSVNLRNAIEEILKGADLDTLSAKKVRTMLEEKYSTDLSERKKEVDEVMMAVIDEITAKKNDEEEEEEEEEEKVEKKKPVTTKQKPPAKKTAPSKVSNQVSRNGKRNKSEGSESNSFSEEELSETKPPKKKAKPSASKTLTVIKSKEIVDDSDEEDQIDDAELAQKLQEEENTGTRTTRHRSVKKLSKPKKERVKRKITERKGGSAYSRACLLSQELASIMGTDKMARNEVVKRMWQIVRERHLEDPKNKQFMICDDELLKVFGKKKIRTFGMMKYLKNHIKDEKDVAGR